MNFEQFAEKLEIMGWEIVAFNTYHLNGIHYYYIMVAMNGEAGEFKKDEKPVADMEFELDNLMKFILM